MKSAKNGINKQNKGEKMTVKELKELLKDIPDDFIVWDYGCVREIDKTDIIIDLKEKIIGYEN